MCITSLRFRALPDEQMKHFADYLAAGKPFIGLRTSTHAFNGVKGTYKWFNDFGKQVLGEKWVSHWGVHKKEATQGDHRGVGERRPDPPRRDRCLRHERRV